MLNLDYLIKRKDLFQTLTGFPYQKFQLLLPKFDLAFRKAQEEKAYSRKRLREAGAGRPWKLKSSQEKLFFILFYYRQYPTMRLASSLFEVYHSKIHTWVHYFSKIVFEALGYQLNLPQVKVNSLYGLYTVCPQLREFIVDGTERPIRRPKESQKQKDYFSGKSKRHTVKNQILVSPKTKRILYAGKTRAGSIHDKTALLMDNILIHAPPNSTGLSDLGFDGIEKDYPHLKVAMPLKKKPKEERSRADRLTNQGLSSVRARVEQVIGRLKINRILADTFRNRLTFADEVFKTCCCLYNFKLNYSRT